MLGYIAKRLLGLLPTLVIVGLLVFLFVHLLPGDPARLAAGPDATPETVDLVRKDLGLDRSLPEQFARFVAGVVRFDFGNSIRTKRPVATEIADRFMRVASTRSASRSIAKAAAVLWSRAARSSKRSSVQRRSRFGNRSCRGRC